jgi:CTP synthase (UTP-ammonia lyase)
MHRFNNSAMKIAARDTTGEVRAIELDNHPFFIATLFQPERAALKDQLPPLVKAFVAAI